MTAFERVSDYLREVVVSASEFARFRGYQAVDTRHFVFAVLSRGPGHPTAQALYSAGVQYAMVSKVLSGTGYVDVPISDAPISVAFELTRALTAADAIAREHGRTSKTVPDVLLAIVRDKNQCSAHRLFRHCKAERPVLDELLEQVCPVHSVTAS